MADVHNKKTRSYNMSRIKVRYIISMIAFFAPSGAFAQRHLANPYLKLKPDSVVMYDYNSMYIKSKATGKDTLVQNMEAEPGEHIVDGGILAKSIIKLARLSSDTAKVFTNWLSDTAAFGQESAFCFEPHLGIVYWKHGKPKGYISICMDCNVLEPNLKLAAQDAFIAPPGEDAVTLCGPSVAFRRYITGLLKHYHFSHIPSNESMFDGGN